MMKQNNKQKRILNFMQELSWITENYKDISIKDIYRQLQDSNDSEMAAGKLKADTKYLVGVLPTIFQDKELFPKKKTYWSLLSRNLV